MATPASDQHGAGVFSEVSSQAEQGKSGADAPEAEVHVHGIKTLNVPKKRARKPKEPKEVGKTAIPPANWTESTGLEPDVETIRKRLRRDSDQDTPAPLVVPQPEEPSEPVTTEVITIQEDMPPPTPRRSHQRIERGPRPKYPPLRSRQMTKEEIEKDFGPIAEPTNFDGTPNHVKLPWSRKRYILTGMATGALVGTLVGARIGSIAASLSEAMIC